MKRNFLIWLLPVIVLFTACTDLSELRRRLDEHDARLKNLETLISTTNSDIKAMKDLLDAQNKKIGIVSYTELADKSGYELVMSDGSKIVIKHGSVVGVKSDADGQLYWTINGDFMRDADGNKIKASGIAPKLRVNTEQLWEVSVDDGKTWQLVLDADGKPVKATGQDISEVLKITETEDAIIIIYNGHRFTIPKGAPAVEKIVLNPTEKEIQVGGTFIIQATILPAAAATTPISWSSSSEELAKVDQRGLVTAIAQGSVKITATAGGKTAECTVVIKAPEVVEGDEEMNPLIPMSYMSKFYLNKAGTSFVKDLNDNENIGFFSWYRLMGVKHETSNTEGKSILEDTPSLKAAYRVPTKDELLTVFPASMQVLFLSADFGPVEKNEDIILDGEKNTYKCYYQGFKTGIAYAVRLEGNGSKYKAAYRYVLKEVKKDFYTYTVTIRHLGNNATTLADVAKEEYWTANNNKDISRVFTTTGFYMNSDTSGEGAGNIVLNKRTSVFWSETTSEKHEPYAYRFMFDVVFNYSRIHTMDKKSGLPVRLMRK
ncbi:MAG: PL29 family lyase N-terminal domain-containing protein [Porphyromonas sp.]|nr:PL29 family lyase N-terminal domain-containing protein [Porphyromonas sp.]